MKLMGATAKISVSIGKEELRSAKHLAARLGLSLSTFISDAVRERVREQARRAAAEAVLATFEPTDRASPEEMRALLESWQGERKASPVSSKRIRERSRKKPRKSKSLQKPGRGRGR